VELFRFRNVRPIQSQPCDGIDISTLYKPALDEQELKQAAGAVAGQPPSAAVAQGLAWLDRFSCDLAMRSDLVLPDDCVKFLPANWLAQVGSQPWTDTGHYLALTLINAMQQASPAEADVESLCRQLLVFDLVTTLASDSALREERKKLKTAADVQAMVSWRHVIMPVGLFPPASGTPLLARRPGVTDFYVVHDEWNHYEAGEIAAIVNVLPGETFENEIRHSQEVDTLTSTTTVTTTSQLTEKQQTTSSSLSQSSTSDASSSIGVQGQVTASYSYGPASISTSLGAQSQSSQSQSDTKALTTAYQTVQRAVNSVTTQVTTVQSQRTITKDSTLDDHKLQNAGKDVVVGMYRWLTEVHYVQMVRYPNRLVIEVEVPEPGAWLRWALQNAPVDYDHPDPGPFTMLASPPVVPPPVSPPRINERTYTELAARWKVRGLTPPPPQFVTLSVKLTADQPQGNPLVLTASDDTLRVPAGYQAISWTAQVVARTQTNVYVKGSSPVSGLLRRAGQAAATRADRAASAGTTPADPIQYTAADWDVVVTVAGAQDSLQRASATVKNPTTDFTDDSVCAELTGNCGPKDARGSYSEGVKTGTIPITVYAYDFFVGFSCVVNVVCVLLPETYQQWQQTTFDQVAAAYQSLLDSFHLERATRSQQQPGGLTLAGPPELNQQRAITELQRMVIQDLRGTLMGGLQDDQDVLTDGVAPFTGPGEPYVPADKPTQKETDIVQFFEQTLEWENIVYICYPYYWARHDQWVTDATTASADPVFDQFLNAGSARVTVPARPGFENLLLFYLYTGLIWGGSQPPAPNDPDYLSVAQEIEALQKGATDGTPVPPSWAVSLPTTLLWAGTDESKLPKNLHATIPAPPGA
jgi:hypothetical protein